MEKHPSVPPEHRSSNSPLETPDLLSDLQKENAELRMLCRKSSFDLDYCLEHDDPDGVAGIAIELEAAARRAGK